jgi:hypothetical protein
MLRGFLRTFGPGMPVRVVAGWRNLTRIANVLQDLAGVGCRVEKPTNAEGFGWKIVIDGSSDVPLPDGFPRPFPWGDQWCWGIDFLFPPGTLLDPIAYPTVVIYRGALRRGPLTVYTVNSTRFTLTDTPDEDEVTVKLVWQLDPSGDALTAERWTEVSAPADHDGLIVGPLYDIGLSWGLDEDDQPDEDQPRLRIIRDVIHGTVFPTIFG